MSEYDYDANAGDSGQPVAAGPGAATGLITRPRQQLAPSMIAEQQRAKSEIEAALTVAAARPRDEKEALDHILTSCQRPGLAEKAAYEYSRGGTPITGPTIDLMEVVAQHWGNLEFGFRELQRFPGINGQPGESVVEAFAWDLQSNTRRRTQFTVSHSERTKKGLKTFTDPRDIYEWVANQAQRRVRTCLENIIPRDIVDAALTQCAETMHTHVEITPESIAKLVTAFGQFKVTKEAIEARIQRRMDTITPAQVVHLRKIWASLRDGMSQPGDWFATETEKPAASPMEAAKAAVKKAARKPEPQPTPPPEPPQEPTQEAVDNGMAHPQEVIDDPALDDESHDDPPVSEAEMALGELVDRLGEADTLSLVNAIEVDAANDSRMTPETKRKAVDFCTQRRNQIRGKRGAKAGEQGRLVE